MRFATVDNMGPRNASVDGAHAGFHLRTHAAFQVGEHIAQILHADAANQGVTVRPIGIQTVDVGQHDQLAGSKGRGKGGRGGVGVHVEHFGGIVFIRSHGGNHRNTSGGD